MSISNIGVYGVDVRRLTNLLIGASGPPLRGSLPLSGTGVRCPRSVSGTDDRGLVGTDVNIWKSQTPTNTDNWKCYVCLWMLSFRIVLFDYRHCYPKDTIVLLDIHIWKPIILNFLFGSLMILVLLMD